MFRARHVIGAGLLLWLGSLSLAQAATFNVNTLTDAVDSDTADGVCMTATGECSLRAAVQQANASFGADTIELMDGAYYLTLEGDSEDNAATGDLDILTEITINAGGADRVQIDGLRKDRVFQVFSRGSLNLNGLAIRNGVIFFGSGGGIDVYEGRLTVNDCHISLGYAGNAGGGISIFRGVGTINRSVISGNFAGSAGGGLANNDGNLTINYSMIRDNEGNLGLGGGIFNSAWGRTVEINNSSITGNIGMIDGGGIFHLIGRLMITNSTLSNNQATRDGGGLFYSNGNSAVGGAAKLLNVTIADNIAYGRNGGGGVYVKGGVPLYMTNTMVADNSIGSDCYVAGEISSQGNNLDTDGSCTLADDASSISSGISGLAGLADNGGGTLTHALQAGSDAIDAANDSLCPDVDQRGYERPAVGCDMGAFEFGAVAPLVQGQAPVAPAVAAVNSAPGVADMLISVIAGGLVSDQATGVDAEGDPITFEIVTQPTKGRVGWDDPTTGAFTYEANVDATGADSFTYRACDVLLCSAPATVSVNIGTGAVDSQMSIGLAPGSPGTVGSVEVIQSDVQLLVDNPDVDYTQPLGVFAFDVTDIPVTADAAVVVIQLPADAIIDPAAEIRKLDIFGVWQTLDSVVNPARSSGVIDPVAKTITLTLRDNDVFDHDRNLGVINDPVALAVPKDKLAPASDSTPSSTDDQDIDYETAIDTNAISGTAQGGGGLFHPLMLLALLGLWRRRLN